jgi:hypothetical protein
MWNTILIGIPSLRDIIIKAITHLKTQKQVAYFPRSHWTGVPLVVRGTLLNQENDTLCIITAPTPSKSSASDYIPCDHHIPLSVVTTLSFV